MYRNKLNFINYMSDFLSRLLRAVAFGLIALIGLVMALIFTFSTIVAIGILFIASKLRGQRFSPQEYWTSRQSRQKSLFIKGNLSRDNVTDVQARDVR